MAKLVLTIQPKDEGALKSVQALKAEVQSLSKSLSSIKVTSSGVETTRKGYANLITTLKTLKSQYADGVFGRLPKDAERSFRRIQKISAAFQKNKTLTEGQAKAYANLSQKLKKLSADLATVKAKNDKIVAANPFTVTQAQQIPRLIKQYSTLLNTIRNTEKYYPKGTFDTFKADLTQGQQELQALNNEFLTTGTLSQDSQVKLNNLANGYNQLNASIAQTTSTMKSSKGGLLDIISGFAKFQLSAMLVMKPLQMIRSALASINETLVKTEDAVIALQRVLPSGSATDDEISGKVYEIAERYGQTFENVSTIATNFARTGMSWADTIKATEAAVLALNVAELDATEASDGMIAILTQFGLKAEDLQLVVDKLNITADNAAVTTEKLLAALQRTGSAASNANLSLDQTISLITALSKATGRSGENIGTALNSLIQYSSKASALNTFAGLSEQSAAVVAQFRQGGATILDVWRQVSEEIKNLKSDQADLLDQYFATEDGEALKDALDGELEDIYTELGGVYDTANTFRKNYFIALLGNMDTVERAMGTLGDAAGYSQAENEKALQTYTKRLNSLKAQWEDIANSEQGILGIKKALVDVGSVLLTIIKWTGGLRTTLLAISTVVWMLVGDKIISGFKAIGTALKGLVTGFRTATTAAQGFQAALGWIGAIATAISLIVGLVEQASDAIKRAEEERRNAAQSSISDVNDTVSALNEYINKLDELKSTQEQGKDVTAELSAVQDELKKKYEGVAEAIGKSNDKLQDNIDLTSEAARQAAIQDALRWRLENEKAIQEATKDVETSVKVGSVRHFDDESKIDLFHDIQSALNEAGFGEFFDARITHGQHKNAYASGKFSFEGLKDNVISQIEEINAYINEKGLGIGVTQEELDLLKGMLSEAYNSVNTEAYKADKGIYEYNQKIEKLLNGGSLAEFLGIQEETNDNTEEWHNNISKVTKKYDDLISKLKELRDAEKESLDLEEKKKDYLEAQNELIKAQQALENARNEATVRRYNQATGQWEWQVDEKKVAEAEETVKEREEGVEQARKDLEEQAYDSIIELLNEQDPPTNEELIELLDGLKEYLGDGFIGAIKRAILEKTNVDFDKPVDASTATTTETQPRTVQEYYEALRSAGMSEGSLSNLQRFLANPSLTEEEVLDRLKGELSELTGKTYDSGGAAIGKGLMPKATDEAEIVNNPDLTSKILQPVSNEQFHRYVRDMGILFETSRQYAQKPVIERVGGNTDNRVDNSGQIIIKDVNVGAEQRDRLLEILALAGIIPNV